MTHIIQIRGDDFEFEIHTQTEVTSVVVKRMEKQLNAIVNENLYHDISGRMTSINMSLYMLERLTPPNAKRQLDLLKSQLDDLSHMIESLIH